MTSDTGMTMHKGAAALIATILIGAGAGATYLLMRDSSTRRGQQGGMSSPAGPPAAAPVTNSGPLPDVAVPLSQDAVQRAGIVVTSVGSGTSAIELRLPGVVEPNAYNQVVVTPLVAGRVTKVGPALGDRVRPGQTLAEIYSPALAEAQTRYVSAQAMLDAHDRELQRTERLVEIGAASRQELERIHAEHAAQTVAVQSARSQLELLGGSASALDSPKPGQTVNATMSVPAPIEGVVTERGANAGVNVDPSMKLFTIVDLSTVWVVASVYERDMSRVRVGSEAVVTTAARPDQTLRGHVSYIDPQVNAETRTAKLRVELPNPGGELRFGMYADVRIAGAAGESVLLIPRSAVQNLGERTVVYLAKPDESGTFIEREVRLGQASGDRIEVVSGIQSGDRVVTEGSFSVRAERERLGLRPPPTAAVDASGSPSASRNGPGGALQTAKVVVTEQGYEPARLTFRAGLAARITFLRTTDKTCGTEVVFPSLNIKRTLPLNEPVLIEFMPQKSGEIAFACGMNMLKGIVAVK